MAVFAFIALFPVLLIAIFLQVPPQNLQVIFSCPNLIHYQDGRLAWFVPIIIGAVIGGISNVAVNWDKIGNFWQGFKFFGIGAVVGGAAGYAGYGASQWIGSALSNSMSLGGGFVNGALIGAGSGAAAGFIGGAGNSWINGGGFGQGLLSGLKGAGIGAVSGAISGGIVKGIKDAKNGFSFWNGTSIQAVPDIGSTSILSDQSALNDEALQALIKQEFQISEGDLNLQKITTTPSNSYTTDQFGNMFNGEGKAVGGYVKYSSNGATSMHIAPKYVGSDIVHFRAVVGHELQHAYHYSLYGASYNKIFSESVAYNWTKGIYLNAGASYFNAYLEILKFQWLNGFTNTGGYPTFYGGWQK